MKPLDSELMAAKYRTAAIDLPNRRILVTRFAGSLQEKDFTEPTNCDGLGRIRHFRRSAGHANWPKNPLPIDPASRALGLSLQDEVHAQVFQNAVCNWRCWYCFVDFDLLRASRRFSQWVSPQELLDLYLHQEKRPPMIDLTGGQPDLTPEWVPWMMHELQQNGLSDEVYLWSDDNLSNDYFWKYLSPNEHELISSYSHYGRVCCFKGFNEESFSFNTMADSALFNQQFDLFARLLSLGIDLYAYVTLTTPSLHAISRDVPLFVDRLQAVDPLLPLRTIPLEIRPFTPVKSRLNVLRNSAIEHQRVAVECWLKELDRRFSSSERSANICEIKLNGGRSRTCPKA